MLEKVAKNLAQRVPVASGLRLAAVSVILDSREDPKVLLIKRADRAGDPWSGQIAFPGGKTRPGDETARRTAVREAMEEVGIDLERSAEFMGYGMLTTTHTGTMEVVPSVFLLNEQVAVVPNEEVASYRWVGLRELFGPGARSGHDLTVEGRSVRTPAFVIGDYVVWGLTYRILASMVDGPV